MEKPKKWIGAMNGGEGPKKGALHKELGVPEGKDIPKSKLAKAAKAGGTLGRRARLAETLEGMHGKKDNEKTESKKDKMDERKGMEHATEKKMARKMSDSKDESKGMKDAMAPNKPAMKKQKGAPGGIDMIIKMGGNESIQSRKDAMKKRIEKVRSGK
jgi:hypothetical protein